MTTTVLIQCADGTYVRKARAELRDTDMVVFDGPDTHAALEAAQARLESEIAAAGGIEKWKVSAPAGADLPARYRSD